jgi:hypothetical protein
MIDLSRLRVSLTKNGYFKVAELLKVYSRWEVLEHLGGEHPGIDIQPSQIRNIMDQSPTTDEVPEFWDLIRGYGPQAIDAFTLTATMFSHERLIGLFQTASQDQPEFKGQIRRDDLPSGKEYTNLAFALACFGVSDYRRGASAVEYDLTPVVYHLRNAGVLVQDLVQSKLRRAGWIDPSRNPRSPDRDLMTELRDHQFNRVLSMDWPRFEEWLGGRLEMPPCVTRFGLQDVGLFTSTLPPAGPRRRPRQEGD